MNKLVTKTPIQGVHERYNIARLSNGNFYWQKGNKWYNKQGKEVKGKAALKELKFAEATSKAENAVKNLFSKINDNGNRYFTTKDGKYNVFQNGEVWDTKTGKKVEKLPKSNSQKKNVTSTNTSARISKNTSTGISKSIPVTTRNNSNNSTGIGRFQSAYADKQNLFEGSGEFKGQNIRQVQQMLGVKDDGIWGPETQAAYERWKDKNSEQSSTTNLPDTSISNSSNYTLSYTPIDFSNYSVRDISNLGFNNYNELGGWVKNNRDHWFSQSLLNRFGEPETWDQNYVENSLNVKGRYGKGFLGKGDYSDMFNSQKNYEANYKPKNITTPTYTTPVSQMPSDWRSGRNINWIGYFRNQLQNNYRPLYAKEGGLIPKSPIKRFQTNFNKF